MATNEDLEKIKAALGSSNLDSMIKEDEVRVDYDSMNYNVDYDTIKIDELVLNSNISSWNTTLPPSMGAMGATGNITISTGGGGFNGTSGYNYYTTSGPTYSTTPSSLSVTGDADFAGDITWKGRSLSKILGSIEDRLAILQDPDPKKLEKYEALKKAYEHYKTLERLIGED